VDDLLTKTSKHDFSEVINAMKDERYQYFIKLFKNGDLNVNFRTRFIKGIF